MLRCGADDFGPPLGRRRLKARIAVDLALVVDAAADVVLSITPPAAWIHDEQLGIVLDGRTMTAAQAEDAHGGRVHRLVLAPGAVEISYRAETRTPVAPAPSDDLDPVRYLRPSRYAQSDVLFETAALFSDSTARDTVSRIAQWVHDKLSYVPGSSSPTDSAVDTLRAERGVCRDYAHLTIALLRARGIPARLVSAFAPGLDPMDFHAVVEAFVDGRWEVVDPTRLAPRPHLVRIATGRDAADTAFLTTLSGAVSVQRMTVMAVASDSLAHDDHVGAVLLR
ncbi:transglutaminase family protein [Microbacterium sp. NPDC090007]|uniref:transglutaminase-like domain-containing protein n=1 Tax=Microbacterium sp. NPDC090007 TaxID=3364204 RepID=UPI003800F5E9